MTSRVCRIAGVLLAFQVLVAAQGAPTAPTAKAVDFFRAIRANDVAALRLLAAGSEAVGVKDALGTTPLHYAATYGSTESVRILLEHGADVRARTTVEVTPLMFAAYSLEKTRLLVEKGADVNARSKTGVTPLMVASSVHGNAATVHYLLEQGADPKAVSATGADALTVATFKGDAEGVRSLLAKGADARHADTRNATALMSAFETSDPEVGRLLLEAGSEVNAFNTDAGRVKNGPIALVHLTPLMFASPGAAPSTVAMLLKAGAKVNDADIRQMTPLMLAVANDDAKLATVQQLIGAGADVNAKDVYGDSVLDWALKFRNPEILATLERAGAKSNRPATPPSHPDFAAASPADAIARASALLAASADKFYPAGGNCVGCHHQPQVARAYAAVRAAGLTPVDRLQKIFREGVAVVQGGQALNLPLMVSGGGDYDGPLYQIMAMADLGDPAGPATDAIVQYLAARQDVSGAWTMLQGPRPPLESGSILRTAMAIRALKTYAWPARQQEFDERIARARKWLLAARPTTSYEQAYRAAGLQDAGATESEVAAAGRLVLAQQRSDGGWSQNPYLESDAYATSVALQSLREAGVLKPSDASYRRGVAYLLRTQFPDGSWYVASRAPKLQPYFESAFPYGHDQWISVAATSFAVMALAPAATQKGQ
jgi:ankyrin repeat protein